MCVCVCVCERESVCLCVSGCLTFLLFYHAGYFKIFLVRGFIIHCHFFVFLFSGLLFHFMWKFSSSLLKAY